MAERDVIIAPGTESSYEAFHYSSAVRAGGLLFCSGVTGSVNGVASVNAEEQFTEAFEALGRVLSAASCDFGHVVEITTFHVNYPLHLDIFMAVKDRYLSAPWPAWTAVGVASLSRPEVLLEIKATAALIS